MPYLTRDDGERFVIPSYRDVLRARKPALLKREMALLATNYGDYVTFQRKGKEEYEVAFSTEAGYLLGETVWAYFNRPQDLVYCEAIPDTPDAILVIVKNGSVYLDGSFPVDSIPEELVIFKTQTNAFNIYVYGDVPISDVPEEGKFFFDASSVHSFHRLEQPLFPTLPVLKAFQLQLIDVVLKSQGIGVFPIKPFVVAAVVIALGWMGWVFFAKNKVEIPASIINVVNPYQTYINALTSPSPSQQVQNLAKQLRQLFSIPGWVTQSVAFSPKNGYLAAQVKSNGGSANTLDAWAKNNDAEVKITQNGFFVNLYSTLNDRQPPRTISRLNEVIASLVDRFSTILPGSPLHVSTLEDKGQYVQTTFTVEFTNMPLTALMLIGQHIDGLPLILSSATIDITDNFLSGSLVFTVLGN